MTENSSTCESCRRPKASHQCGLCKSGVCKACSQFLPEDTFTFDPDLKSELKHTYYCPHCHSETVEPALALYNETLERAENVYIFFTTQKTYIPALKRSKEILRVKECPDRDEAILRLAFLAAKQDFNAVTDVLVSSEKVRDGAYQTMKWKAQGCPALVDEEKMARR